MFLSLLHGLYYKEKKPNINNIQKHKWRLWTPAHLRWTDTQFRLFLEIMDIVSSGTKRKRTIQIVVDTKFRSQQLWWSGVVLVSTVWGTAVKAPLMRKGKYRFWSDTCCHPDNVFFQGRPAYLTKTMPNHILHVTTAWLRSKRVLVLDWPACLPERPPIENVRHILKHKSTSETNCLAKLMEDSETKGVKPGYFKADYFKKQ